MNAAKITRESKSNLALTFVALDRTRRRDITTFYAFCRIIDDIADDVHLAVEEKQRRLDDWRQSLRGQKTGAPVLAPEMRALMTKYSLGIDMLEEIIAGVEMDLTKTRYATFDELRIYCYRVASAVGLVSIEIFGYRNPACKEYAVELGLALQTTNIIRDVAKDLRAGRIYLPQDEISQFGYSETQLLNREYNAQFLRLMEFQAARAEEFFDQAAAILPSEDRSSMVAAEIMAALYRRLLRQMESDRFRVFEKEYRLTKWAKARHIATQLLRSCIRNGT